MNRLQFNMTGAWRNVVDYPAYREVEVRQAAVNLARIVGAKVRVLNQDGKVLMHWTQQAGWHKPF